ncbi:TetR/AcrR family transcriptional regulator [Beijerinckia sp. L45]|uniref:TetR/AcrR family transcriptional regulator n=1 Tax=Beijerinckia sp. L45 TaxID=1641855 RepID=UPI00131D93BD|nr:TetR/AcrR family transcriptional regulator [Beijerinckia sp. L45]
MRDLCGLRRRRKEARPSEILDAAFQAFAADGFAGTRLDDVAARAGITKGTIYLYFQSKEDLFVAVLKQMMWPAYEHLSALTTEPSGPAIAMLRAHLTFTANCLLDDPRQTELFRMLIAEGPRFPDVVDRWHAEVLVPIRDAFEAVIAYGIDRGEFRPSALGDLSLLLISPIMLAKSWLGLFGTRHPLDVHAFVETSLRVFAHGLLVEDAKG